MCVQHLASRLGPHSKSSHSDPWFFSKLIKIEVKTLKLRNKAWKKKKEKKKKEGKKAGRQAGLVHGTLVIHQHLIT